MKVVDLRTDYGVGTKKVKLSIVIGNRQIGSSVVKVNSTVMGKGDITELDLGSGNSLVGKKLTIKSIVADVNDQTNQTVITYRLKGGARDQDFESSGTVDEDGDSIIYRALFSLR